METTDRLAKALTDIALDGAALNDAALVRDWEEARFRCRLVAAHAEELGLEAAHGAARTLGDLLGRAGTVPSPGYGLAIVELSVHLDELPLTGLP